MKTRSVIISTEKINSLESKNDVVEEIVNIQELHRIEAKKFAKSQSRRTVSCVLGIAFTIVGGFLVLCSSFSIVNNYKNMKDLASQIITTANESQKEEFVNMYSSAEKSYESSRNVLITAGAMITAGLTTAVISQKLYNSKFDSYIDFRNDTQNKINKLYDKKEELEQKEN